MRNISLLLISLLVLFSFNSCKNKTQKRTQESRIENDKINYALNETVEPCDNFYEYVCSNIRDSYKTSLKKNTYLFASIFREHVKTVKGKIAVPNELQTKITHFKEKCMKIEIEENVFLGEDRCQTLGENIILQEVYAKNINEFIANYAEKKEKVFKIFNSLKATMIEKIKVSSIFAEDKKNTFIEKLNKVQLIVIEPKLEKVESDLFNNFKNIYLDLLLKYDFFNSIAFSRESINGVYIYIDLNIINVLSAPTASSVNENQVAFLLGHEFGHIIDGINFTDIFKTLAKEFNSLPENSEKFQKVLSSTYGVLTYFENFSDFFAMTSTYENFLVTKVKENNIPHAKEIANVNKDFFIGYARSFCASKEEENKQIMLKRGKKKDIYKLVDPHARPNYRVNLGVKRIADFSKLYQCSAKHKLNFDPSAEIIMW